MQVLSHPPPRALVTQCRPVCRAWRDVVDGPSVWLLQLARDCSAEGRALDASAQRCPADGDRHDELAFRAPARFYLRAPLGRPQPHLQPQRRAWVPGAGPNAWRRGLLAGGRGVRRGEQNL